MQGAGLPALDLSALLQFVLLALFLFSVLLLTLRRAASRYFVVDASFEVGHETPRPAMSIGSGSDGPSPAAANGAAGACAVCGKPASKKCSGCKRARYCSQACQSKHWNADHKFKCKKMRLFDNAEVKSSVNGAGNKSSFGFHPISLVPACKQAKEVLFPYDDFLKLFNWENPGVTPCGLFNCGNSCFANVVLQCLASTRPLAAYLLRKDHDKGCVRKQEDWCFLCELQAHVQRASESSQPFSPINILSRLPNIGGNLGYGRQEDAHEFMRFAIDKMQSACLEEFGGEKVLDLSTQETTLIQHIFGGHLQSQVRCSKCEVMSNRYENMMDLTVEIQGDAESVEECLVQFTAGEWLDGENKYKCDGCNDYVKAWKRLTIHQAPNVLTIALKRFQSGRFGKLNKRITFPVKLDLTPYISSSDGSDKYDLYAVVVHLDMLNASFFGHYICYMKDYHGRWYRVDDCKVMLVEVEEVLAQGAYMLLYSRTTARQGPLGLPNAPINKPRPCQVALSCTPNIASPMDGPRQLLNVETEPESLEDSADRDTGSERKLSTFTEVIKDKVLEDMDVDTSFDIKTMPISRDQRNTDAEKCPSDSSASEGPSEVGCVRHCPMQENALTMASDQLSPLPTKPSFVNSVALQHREPSVSSDLDSYLEVDNQSTVSGELCPFDAGENIVRASDSVPTNPSHLVETLVDCRRELEQLVGEGNMPRNDNQANRPNPASHGRIGSEASSSSLENGSAGKPNDLFSRGFLDRPSRRKSLDSEKRAQTGNGIAVLTMTNYMCNGHLDVGAAKQETRDDSINSVPSSANNSSSMTPFSVSGVTSVNSDDNSGKGSSAQNGRDIPEGDVSFLPRGFLTMSCGETPFKNNARSKTHGPETDCNGFAQEAPADPRQETSSRTGNGKFHDIDHVSINGAVNGTEDRAVKLALEYDSNSRKDEQMKSVSRCPTGHDGLRRRVVGSEFGDQNGS